ncbi:MAG: antitoxin Xre/MbcA/ParS toxin-binding domain-containing protein, partial [Bacteroidota bacterium]
NRSIGSQAEKLTPIDFWNLEKMSYQTLAKALNLQQEVKTPFDLMALARQGLYRSALDSLGQLLELSTKDLVQYLHISERTLQRYDQHKKLSSELSDHLIQIAKVYARAVEVFEDHDRAVQWLKYPSQALGVVTPLSCLDNYSGIELVLDELGRLEYGVYA